jgi:hypothetical protein
VNCLPGDNVRNAADRLPLGWYRDATFLGRGFETSDAAVGYVPILTYQGKHDHLGAAILSRALWVARMLPKTPGMTLTDVLDAQSLARLRQRLAREEDRFPPGTLFQLGIEPGYSTNRDDRSPADIVKDARRVKAMLDGLGRGYRLALGGISTQGSPCAKRAYGGMYGLEFFRHVLDAAEGFEFDTFVVHPYPADLTYLASQDSRRQIVDFRAIMAQAGLRNTDLIVGEIGMPFPGVSPQDAAAFASQMIAFLLTARDDGIGNPGDGNRLVQRFCWFNLLPPTFKVPGITDNPGLDLSASALLSPSGDLTPVGKAFREAAIRCANGHP